MPQKKVTRKPTGEAQPLSASKTFTIGTRVRVTSPTEPLILCEITKTRGVNYMSQLRLPFPAETGLNMTVKPVSKPDGSQSLWFIHGLKRKGNIVGYGARCVALIRFNRQKRLTITSISSSKSKNKRAAA